MSGLVRLSAQLPSFEDAPRGRDSGLPFPADSRYASSHGHSLDAPLGRFVRRNR